MIDFSRMSEREIEDLKRSIIQSLVQSESGIQHWNHELKAIRDFESNKRKAALEATKVQEPEAVKP